MNSFGQHIVDGDNRVVISVGQFIQIAILNLVGVASGGEFAQFERYGVSFVSVTQQFNTTTSMGRLMLNILLSFAQFEREVTGERIRDKIAASKRKGMWMGGVPPLGYDVENRRLVPNEREAKLVLHIFQRFVELGSSTALVKELKLDGVTSKAWTTQDGKTRDGRPIDKGHIYKLLSNRTYLGELRHKEQWYQAEHPPIISRELWDSVHAILATNGRVRGNATRATVAYLLKGIVFGNDGRALSPWHTTKKNGRRYRYYVPQRDVLVKLRRTLLSENFHTPMGSSHCWLYAAV